MDELDYVDDPNTTEKDRARFVAFLGYMQAAADCSFNIMTHDELMAHFKADLERALKSSMVESCSGGDA